MGGNGAVEEERVCIVDDLLKDKVFQLKTRGKGRIRSRVARSELRTLCDGVVIGAPDKLDGITDGSVDGERDITEDTLGRSNIDDVSLAGLAGGAIVGRHRRGIIGPTLLDTIVVGIAVTPPACASGTIGGGWIRLIHGGRCTVRRRGIRIAVSTIGVVVAPIRIVVAPIRIVITTIGIVVSVGVVATIVHVVTAVGGERGRCTPSARWGHLIVTGRIVHVVTIPAMLNQNVKGRARMDRILTSCQWVLENLQEAALRLPQTDEEQEGSRR